MVFHLVAIMLTSFYVIPAVHRVLRVLSGFYSIPGDFFSLLKNKNKTQ